MTKHRGLVVVLTACVGLAAAALTGCRGDARSDLAKATDKARRLYDRACSELKDPVFQVGGQYVPVTPEMARADGNDITLLPAGAINPQVDDALQEAIDALTGAMGSEAPPRDKAQAHAMLARIQALVGYRNAVGAAQQREKTRALLRTLELSAIRMGDHGKRIANCDALLSVTDPTLAELAGKAKAGASAAQTKIGELQGKIDTLLKEKADLEAENQKLLAAARKLRVESQLAGPMKGIELFDKAKVQEDKATANAVRLTEIEDTVQFLKSQIAVVQLDVDAAGRTSAAAAAIAQARTERKAETQKQRDEFVGLLTAEQTRVKDLAAKATEAWQGAKALEGKATAAYAAADEQYDQYGQATSERGGGDTPKTDPGIIAMHGDMRMERGSMHTRAVSLQSRIDYVVDEVTGLWSALPVQKTVPEAIGQLRGYLADKTRAGQQAKEDFRWAAKSYEKAVKIPRGVDDEQQWAYHLQVAAAYASLYRLTGDSGDRKSGSDALEQLGSVEGSRFIAKDAAHYRKLLAAAPADANAPMP